MKNTCILLRFTWGLWILSKPLTFYMSSLQDKDIWPSSQLQNSRGFMLEMNKWLKWEHGEERSGLPKWKLPLASSHALAECVPSCSISAGRDLCVIITQLAPALSFSSLPGTTHQWHPCLSVTAAEFLIQSAF